MSAAFSNPEFGELLDRVRSGDNVAMGELVTRYERDILIIARSHLGKALRPYLDSLDLVQSVQKSLWVGLRAQKFDFTGPEKLLALAATIVRRKVAKRWRKQRRQNRGSGIRMPNGELIDFVTSIADRSSTDPAEIIANRDQVAFALSQLDGVDRELVRLRLDGFSTVNAAEQLGINPDVVRVRLSRLRRKLKDTAWFADLV